MTKDIKEEPKEEPKKVVKKRTKTTKFRKAPQAPKRFKSAFIFFSVEKHPEIRQKLQQGKNSDVPNVAKLVSEAWRNLNPEERAVWEKKAEDDKKRYELERTMYTGPWKVPASKRAKKDPDAPKRPMSAFLAYSKKMRSQVKQENPHLSNTDVSKLLATKWKEAPEEERNVHIKKEAEERGVYKVAISEWRANQEQMLEQQRKQREQIAQMAIQNGTCKPEHHTAMVAHMPPGYPHNAYGYPQHPMSDPNMPHMNGASPPYHDPAAYPQTNPESGQEYGWPNGPPENQSGAPSNPSYWGEPRSGTPTNPPYWGEPRLGTPYGPPEAQQSHPYGHEPYNRTEQRMPPYGPPETHPYYSNHEAYPNSYPQHPPYNGPSSGSWYPNEDRHSSDQPPPPPQQPPYPSDSSQYSGSEKYPPNTDPNIQQQQQQGNYPAGSYGSERYEGQYYGNGHYEYS